MIARKSVEYIDQRVAASTADQPRQPFFLYVPFASPHTPILPSPQWQDQSGLNRYGDFVMETDWAVGEILRALERYGIADDTLVIFTSDNGCSPQAKFEELAEQGHYPSGPLRGHKADIFEGGHRVPFVVRWPGEVAPGSESDQLVCLTDIFATVAEITATAIPDHAAEDSFSLLSVLRGQGDTGGARDHLVSHSINGSFAIRQGDWKLLLCPDSGGWSEPRPGSKPAAALPSRQLYHLSKDLGEQSNLIEQEPQRARELLSLLERLVEDGRSTPGEPQENNGQVDLRAAAPGS
jgi:arylsulfatase A-like enzyme